MKALEKRLMTIKKNMGKRVVFRVGVNPKNEIEILTADLCPPNDGTMDGPSIEEMEELKKSSYIG